MTKTEILAVVKMLEGGMSVVPSPEAVETHVSRIGRNLGGDIYAHAYVERAIRLKRAGDESYTWYLLPSPSQVKAHLKAIREWRKAGANI